MADKKTYPRIPESNWWTIRNQFKKTLPATVNTSYIKGLLNLTNEQSASNLLPPLRQFGIIDEEGKPLPRANDWRNDEKYKETCAAIAKEVFPIEIFDLFPGPDYDKERITNWFMHEGGIGEAAAKMNTTTFMILMEGIPKTEVDVKKAKSNSKRDTKQKEEKITREEKQEQVTSIGGINKDLTIRGEALQNDFLPKIHIDLQIHISPDAKSDQIEAIFASIAKYLYNK